METWVQDVSDSEVLRLKPGAASGRILSTIASAGVILEEGLSLSVTAIAPEPCLLRLSVPTLVVAKYQWPVQLPVHCCWCCFGCCCWY